MKDDGAIDKDDAGAVQKQNLRLERRIRQIERVAKSSEQLANQSEAAYRRTVADLEEATKQAESAVLAKDLFLATMSHEIRTPMNGVIGCIDLIDRAPMSEEQRQIIDTLQVSANSLLLLLNDVLDFAKLESGRTTLEAVPFRLDQLLEEVAQLHTATASASGVEVRTHWGAELRQNVVGDPHRLRQVIHNLTSNAVKFTTRGSVVLSAERRQGTKSVRIEVKDTGIGMSDDVLDSIFIPFRQADESTTRRFGGTGLGLAICKSLVEAMGSQIEVHSELGSGSTFSFEIELEVAEGVSNEPAREPTVWGAPEPRLEGLRVLLVDDAPVNLLVAEKMLGRLGCDVFACSSGSEAVDLATGQDWDVILMDCSMPDVDGYEASRRIRAAESGKRRVSIVALTAFAMPGDCDKSFAAGMDRHLTKPLKLEALREALADCIAERDAAA